MESRLEQVFRKRMGEGRKALIVYLCAGDPSLEITQKAVKELAGAGADIIELGIPFSDPVADGPIIQAASLRALSQGTDLQGVLRMVGNLREEGVDIPLVLLSYYNPLLQFGLERAVEEMAHQAIEGILIPDLPFEESQPLRDLARSRGLSLITLVAPNTPQERLKMLAGSASGFIYCVSLMGVTGPREELSPHLKEYLLRVRKAADGIPLAVGFGISNAQQARLLAPWCDGVIVGSAVVEALAQGGVERAVELVKEIRSAI
ncbi:MAG TPA: tryptophan synthase subunit alpha [Moorella mulderi]|nr:tryptophan synthase subunit alpha [Moorella mulderi]